MSTAKLVEGIQQARNLLLYPTAPWDETRAEVLKVLDALVHEESSAAHAERAEWSVDPKLSDTGGSQ